MSVHDPVEVVKEVWRRYAEGGLPATMPYVTDEIEWAPHDVEAGGARLSGRDAILARGRELAAAGVRMEAFGHRFEAYDGCVVVVGRLRVHSPEGHSDVPMNWQVEVAEGRITAVRAERRLQDAREDCAA
jgi:hypothetical protein